jgi:serine protease Do
MPLMKKILAAKWRKVLLFILIIGILLAGALSFSQNPLYLIDKLYQRIVHKETGDTVLLGKNTKQSYSVAVPDNFTELTKLASPTVVNIRAIKNIKIGDAFRQFRESPFDNKDPFYDFFNRFFRQDRPKNYRQRSLGSGFIIDKEGYIVTNNHVVENTDKISVILKNEKEFDAKIVGRDINTDLALIKIETENELPVAKIGDSDTIKVGQWVVAIGSPFGLAHTVTAGIISAKGRIIGSGPYDDFIQTDASINPGNSGGPLINMKGEVIGINTMIVAGGQGIGFAIPINLAKGIVDQLKDHGDVTRGWLGITIQDLPEDLADYFGLKDKKGALVTDVIPGDPADKAGIKLKDIIIEVNGVKIDSSRSLLKTIAAISVGEIVNIKVLREGKARTFKVKIGKRPDSNKIAKREPNFRSNGSGLGITVSELTDEITERLNLNEYSGIIVTRVDPGSKADKAGIRVNDIIKEINHTEVESVNDYQMKINDIDTGQPIQIFLMRINRGYMLVNILK